MSILTRPTVVFAIVFACFAVLIPRIFLPLFRTKPSVPSNNFDDRKLSFKEKCTQSTISLRRFSTTTSGHVSKWQWRSDSTYTCSFQFILKTFSHSISFRVVHHICEVLIRIWECIILVQIINNSLLPIMAVQNRLLHLHYQCILSELVFSLFIPVVKYVTMKFEIDFYCQWI